MFCGVVWCCCYCVLCVLFCALLFCLVVVCCVFLCLLVSSCSFLSRVVVSSCVVVADTHVGLDVHEEVNVDEFFDVGMGLEVVVDVDVDVNDFLMCL